MNRSLLLVLSVMLLMGNTVAQARDAREYDSLYAAAFSGATDTVAAQALSDLARWYWQSDRDSMPEHLAVTQEQLELYHAADASPDALYQVELALGSILKQMGDAAGSIQHLFSALAHVQRIERPDVEAYIHMEIGLNYYLQRNWTEALEYFRLSKAYYRTTGDVDRINVQEYLIALCLSYSKQYREAVPILRSLYLQWREAGNLQRMMETGSGFADALRGIDSLEAAESLYLLLIDTVESNPEMKFSILGRLQAGLANVYYEQGRLAEAEEMALSSLEYVRPYDYFFPKLEAQDVLYQTYRDQAQWKEALTYYEQLVRDRDSLQSEGSRTQLSVAKAIFDHEQQQAATLAEEARKQQVLIVGLILSGILVVVVGLFYRSLSNQKKTSERLLANILPRETITELKSTGSVAPRIHHGVSIMFCDVREFTVIAEALSPTDLVTMLDSYIQRFDEIVHQYGLEKIKTIGDAYMIAGGLHGDTEAAALNCIRAAQDMLAVVEDLRPWSNEQYGFAFDYRMGIHTGNVIAGMVGRDKYAYDIWGDAVNVAARMEHHSKIGRINISGDTQAIVRGLVQTEYRGKVTVKNKGEVDMYFVVGPVPGPTTV